MGKWDNGTDAAWDLSTAASEDQILTFESTNYCCHILISLSNIYFQIGEVKVPLCMVDLAQTIEEWKDIQSVKVDDQVCDNKTKLQKDKKAKRQKYKKT